jgi:hypothetical protein
MEPTAAFGLLLSRAAREEMNSALPWAPVVEPREPRRPRMRRPRAALAAGLQRVAEGLAPAPAPDLRSAAH